MKKLLFILAYGLLTPAVAAQVPSSAGEMHHEKIDDPYVYVDRDTMPKSPAYNTRRSDIRTTQVNVDASGNNIVGDAGNEPSLAIDPTNPNRIVIGWRQFDAITSNFRQAGYGYSTDGGLSFTSPGPIDPGIFRSDPVLDFDGDGNFYYNSLQSSFDCDVFKIEDGGVDWDGPFPAKGGDKQWMRMDRTSGIGSKNNYSNWNESFSVCDPGDFTRSVDASETFEDCIEVDGSPRWGTLAVDANGDLFIAGISNMSGNIIAIKSSTAKDASQAVDWDFVTDVNLDGILVAGSPINPRGLTGQAWIDVDLSNDNVYVLASVFRNSNNDPADVMFAKSTDGGLSFEAPIRINTDTGQTAFQWFGTMSVAPNGRIDVIWLDTRDAPSGTNDSVLYYSYSEDEGTTWTPNEAISDAFDPNIGYPMQDKMGDYFDMKSDDDFAHIAWANTLNGGQDVYYTRIAPELLNVDTFTENTIDLRVFPNPVQATTTLQFDVMESVLTSLEIYNVTGKKVKTIVHKTISGNQLYTWNGTNDQGTRLASGLYFATLSSQGKAVTVKILLN
jgi:hypothetical protein